MNFALIEWKLKLQNMIGFGGNNCFQEMHGVVGVLNCNVIAHTNHEFVKTLSNVCYKITFPRFMEICHIGGVIRENQRITSVWLERKINN